VIRGLYSNTLIYSQSKLVNVQKGKILDVAVDFRKGSPTFDKSISIELNSEENKQFFIPRGFLHVFSVLSKVGLVMIKID
ncbi:dTDP-4-dehydrorhamnose 3,5-epimerase family protein, partial [Aliarcobacter butzleri]